ncbi:MAG: TatD family hydrolase [Gammaproteobacteria bacterium]
MLVDSHCHLDMLDLTASDGSLQPFLDAAHDNGIEHMLCVSVNFEDWPRMCDKVRGHPEVSISVGVHPDHADCHEPTVAELVERSGEAGVVAIGETGLDYYHGEGDLEWQRERFRTHIRAARECGKPLIVHTREAREDTLRILREEQAEEAGGVLHCFTEDYDMARQAMELGFYISFSGIVTFKNAVKLKEVARQVPLERLLVETDSPYLAPVPKRGKPNQPAYVRHVAEYLAELRGESFAELAAATTGNFYRLFRSVSRA